MAQRADYTGSEGQAMVASFTLGPFAKASTWQNPQLAELSAGRTPRRTLAGPSEAPLPTHTQGPPRPACQYLCLLLGWEPLSP